MRSLGALGSAADRQLAGRDAKQPLACTHVRSRGARGGRQPVRAQGEGEPCESGQLTRRDVGAGLAAALAAINLNAAQEASALSLPGLPGLGGGSSGGRLPSPVKFPRNKLDQRFAVLLVRSVYDAVDSLDFISMSDFQAAFWKLRQAQYEPYLQQYAPLQIRQGDLTDPLYFDYIAYAQMATIEEAIPRGRQVFEEYCEECPEQKRVVTRNPLFQDNSKLPAAVQRQAGDAIFVGLRDGFREEVFNGPAARPAGTHVEQLAQDVQRILDIFVEKGYALKASVSNVIARCSEGSCEVHGAHGSEGSFELRLDGPANLWGLGALESRNAKLNTAFAAMAIEAYLRHSGVQAQYAISRTPSSVVQQWTLA